jgi:hypothetical protein
LGFDTLLRLDFRTHWGEKKRPSHLIIHIRYDTSGVYNIKAPSQAAHCKCCLSNVRTRYCTFEICPLHIYRAFSNQFFLSPSQNKRPIATWDSKGQSRSGGPPRGHKKPASNDPAFCCTFVFIPALWIAEPAARTKTDTSNVPSPVGHFDCPLAHGLPRP